MSTEPTGEQHGGVIHVSGSLWHLLFDILSIDATDTQGTLRDKGVFEAIHTRLMLPESYTVIGIFFAAMINCWQIIIESPDLPLVVEGLEYPQVKPIYVRNEDGITELVRIEV